MTCSCVNVEIGSYDNQISLKRPAHMPGERPICVDRCLESEITGLWEQGIITTGCCCGHNKLPPFIGVALADIPRMKTLGYVVQPNPGRPEDEDSFYPKTLPIETPAIGKP